MKAVLKAFNWLVALLLLISYLSPYINPVVFWPVAFLGLSYPFILAGNIMFVLFWLIKRKKYLWISFFAILVGWSHVGNLAQLYLPFDNNEEEEYVSSNTSFKVLSYNVRLFDLYNWKYDQNRITRNKIFDVIAKEKADIMFLQEFFMDDTGYFITLDSIVQFQPAKNSHIEYTESLRGVHHWGIATFSKYPIVKRGQVPIESKGNNICIFSDIKIGDDTIRVYNMHLASIHFQYEEFELLQNMGKMNPVSQSSHSRDSTGPVKTKNRIKKLGDKDVKIIDVLLNMSKRLKSAFLLRSRQAEVISSHLSKSPFPVIVCGDFNDTPMSYAYRTISKGLTDAFVNSGKGFGNTLVGPLPYFRIDFVLHDKKLKSDHFRTIKTNPLSDHHPLTVQIDY
jgi:endonuclease/exonuclease/phosphatase family metal-dependent hydrolase